MSTRTVDDEELLALHHAGKTANEIAQALGVTTRTVERYRARLGVSVPSPRSAWRVSPEWKARVEALLEDGTSLAEAARTVGCNDVTMRRHFPGRGWTKEQAGEFGNTALRANRVLRNVRN